MAWTHACGSCGAEVGATAKFCSECGTPLAQATRSAEYKQVTVLFADVVHSMGIAATVGAERLREIMVDLANGCAAVVGVTAVRSASFTGDGIMAVFGAPATLEDHAVRACLSALKIHEGLAPLAGDVNQRDGVELQLRVGLNSGQVIAGEIGAGTFGYTTIGEQVGMAQRMESVAPPGGVMLSASTARLVESVALLGDPEIVQIKGAARRCARAPPAGHGRPASCGQTCCVESCRSAMGNVDGRGLVGTRDRRPWRRRRGLWDRQALARSRLVRDLSDDRSRPWSRAVHHRLRVARQQYPVPHGGPLPARNHGRW